MAGTALTNAFNLGTATVMLGTPEILLDFTPAVNSIGLVKNFSCSSEVGYTELTQGVQNSVVHSVLTSMKNMATMEAYEYTARNMNYALGLDGSQISPQTASTTVRIAQAATVNGISTIPVVNAAGFVVGRFVMIQEGIDDIVQTRKITAVTGGVNASIQVDAPVKMALSLNATLTQVNVVPIGKKVEQPFLAASVVATLAEGREVHFMLPKIRITKGFTVGFNSQQYNNMPLEFTIYDLTPTDPHYALCKEQGSASALLFTKV